MKKIIELKDFYRKESVEFFSTFEIPVHSVTSEVQCTGAKERAKAQGITFSLLYTHAILKAANEIEEFHYRIDEKGNIVRYDTINGIFVSMAKSKKTYIHLLLDYNVDLLTFCKEASDKIHNASHDTILFDMANEYNYLLVSPNPFLSFTAFTQAIGSKWEGFLPLTLVGKLIVREGKSFIPVNISAQHAFVDGFHLGKFYARVEELLMGISRSSGADI